MPTPDALFHGLARARMRARAYALLAGIATLVVAIGGAFLTLGTADWLFHFDPALRAVLAFLVATTTAWVAWRLLIRPLLTTPGDSALAAQIERHFPGFEERLQSAVQFLRAKQDASLGSPALQQRVIDETLAQSKALDFGKVVSFSPLVPVAALAGLLLAIIAGVSWCSPSSASIAARRLIRPFSAPEWPRKNNLRLMSSDFRPLEIERGTVLKVVRGQKLELFVEDAGGRLPDRVDLEYQVADDPKVHEPLRHSALRDPSGAMHDVALLNLPAERGPIRFRAIGGDDASMHEIEMRVVPAPSFESLRVTVTPPKYTAKPAETLAPGAGRIRGVVGTQVSFQGHASQQLSGARLMVKSQAAGNVTLSSDGRELTGTLAIAEPGVYPYSFQLRDAEGIEGDAARSEIDALADLIPEVTVEDPSTDRTVTADAEVPIVVSAKDDLGLRQLQLAFHVGDAPAARDTLIPLGPELARVEHHKTTYNWNLGELAASEGMRIVFHAQGTDWYDLGPPHVGKSPARTLTIISAPQKEAEIVARQADLLRLLERSEQTQARARQQTADLDVQFTKAGNLRPADVDTLKRIQADQGQIRQLLSSPADGAASLVRSLLDEMKQNRIKNAPTQARLERFTRELADLNASHFPTIDDQLTQALKAAELRKPGKPDPSASEGASLQKARREQGVVLESLKTMLGELSRWRDAEAVREGFREVIETQERLNRETSDVSRATLARPFADLNRQEQADLARLAERQSQVVEQLGSVKQRLAAAAKPASDSQRSAAAGAETLLKALEQGSAERTMREIASQLNENKVGQATAGQERVLDELRKAAESLNKNSNDDSDASAARLAAAEQSVERLQKDQEELRKKTEAQLQKAMAGKTKPQEPELQALRKEQERLKEAAEETARELRRTETPAADERMNEAAQHMSNAENALDRGDPRTAQGEQKEALDKIQQAKEVIKKARKQAERKLSQESAVRFADKIAGLEKRQQSVLDETKRLDAEHVKRGNWSRGQLKSLAAVAESQRRLAADTQGVSQELTSVDVYAWVLEIVKIQMDGAAELLADQHTDAETLYFEKEALARLHDLVDAIKMQQKSMSREENSNAAKQGSRQNGPAGDTVPVVAQLILLKKLQEGIRKRTADFERDWAASPSAKAMADILEAEQEKLAELMEVMASRAAKHDLETRLRKAAEGQ